MCAQGVPSRVTAQPWDGRSGFALCSVTSPLSSVSQMWPGSQLVAAAHEVPGGSDGRVRARSPAGGAGEFGRFRAVSARAWPHCSRGGLETGARRGRN